MSKTAHGPNWRGGKILDDKGYVGTFMPKHPRSRPNGYVREHILLAENALGKKLPKKAQIHHLGNRNDNTKIVLCQDQTYHFLLHARAMALSACGNPNWRKCKFCQNYDSPQNLYVYHKTHGWHIYHPECANKYARERYHKNADN